MMISSIKNSKKINSFNRNLISSNAPLDCRWDSKQMNTKTMNSSSILINGKECMSFGNHKNSKDSILWVVKLHDQSLGWLIYTYLLVKKFRGLLIKFSGKKFMGAMHLKRNNNRNFKLHSITHNNCKKFIINGKQSKTTINFKTTKISLPKKTCNKSLSIWVIKREITFCW